MQLKDPKGGAIAAAALTLLGGATPSQAEEKRWLFDTAMLFYTEGADRVYAFEPKLAATLDLRNGGAVNAGFTVDVLTGASPNGAAPSNQPQTFTTPSGNSSFTAAPGELPLDPSFKDTRFAGELGYTMPFGDANKLNVHGNASTEYDYRSLGGGATISRDFNLHDTTVSLGVNASRDSINPVGGAPTPLAEKTGAGGGPDQSKTVLDGLFGVTQVLSTTSLMQVNYSLSRSTGYLNDPYKVVSVVDADGDPVRYLFESRPDSRLKHAAFVQYKKFVIDRDVLEVSYRFMTDDWGIDSHTGDATYRFNFAGTHYLEPHLRWYRQSAADFYRVALDDGEPVTYASGDPRLGAFDGVTVGLKYGQTSWGNLQWSTRLEYYKQIGRVDGLPPVAGAALDKLDVAPDLNVIMLTLGARFRY
ncbi:MAG TPA: DUF3570 domain-containing protein [Nevskiaceae bacterium]|nr:DUF3570 domain-containing protein [Nevskiaceae bacterium]